MSFELTKQSLVVLLLMVEIHSQISSFFYFFLSDCPAITSQSPHPLVEQRSHLFGCIQSFHLSHAGETIAGFSESLEETVYLWHLKQSLHLLLLLH